MSTVFPCSFFWSNRPQYRIWLFIRVTWISAEDDNKIQGISKNSCIFFRYAVYSVYSQVNSVRWNLQEKAPRACRRSNTLRRSDFSEWRLQTDERLEKFAKRGCRRCKFLFWNESLRQKDSFFGSFCIAKAFIVSECVYSEKSVFRSFRCFLFFEKEKTLWTTFLQKSPK